MGTRVQIDGIGTVELDDAFKTKAPAEQQSIIQDIATQHAAQTGGGGYPAGDSRNTPAALTVGPQPTVMDRIVASPVGRFAHDAILQPIAGAASLLAKIDPTGSMVAPMAAKGEKSYQDALSANRNTAGYADARATADARLAAGGGSGLSDQIIAPLAPAMAGGIGLFGGFDASNAAADAQAAGQQSYAAAHPVLSTGAGLAGGFMAGPEGALPRLSGAISGAAAPADAATAYVQRLMASSPTASTPAALRAAQVTAGGKPITAAEAIGKPAEVALGALARREGATSDALGGLTKVRGSAAPQRILGDYAAASGIHPDAARGDIEAFIGANQKAASLLYDAAYKANTNIASPMLDRILETPAGKRALADARTKMQNDMSLMGTPDAELMNQAREGGTDLPARGAASGMKLRVYDYVKKALDDQVSVAYRAGNNHEGGIIKDLKNKMLSELDKADITAQAGPNSLKPEGGMYAQARAKAGEYLGAKKQFEAGQDHILDNNFTAKDFSDYYGKLGDAEKQAYLGGAANKLFNLQQVGRMKADVFKTPIIQSKLATVMGKDKARGFLQNMQTEQAMAEFARKRAPGAGSPTAEYQQAMLDQDGASGLAMDAMNAGHDAIRHGVLPAIGNLVMNKGKNAVASYITRGMAIPVRDAAGQLLMSSPADLASILARAPALPKNNALQLPRLTPQSRIPYGLIGSSATLSMPGRQ